MSKGLRPTAANVHYGQMYLYRYSIESGALALKGAAGTLLQGPGPPLPAGWPGNSTEGFDGMVDLMGTT